jgi:chlorite dismutase
MKRISQFGMVALLLCFLPTLSVASESAVDREKLLKDSGVYATFAVFKMGEHWWQVDHEARVKAASEVKKVFEKHADKLVVDTHLLRGLSERADFLVRIHSKEMVHNQNFLIDLMGTTMGDGLEEYRHLQWHHQNPKLCP